MKKNYAKKTVSIVLIVVFVLSGIGVVFAMSADNIVDFTSNLFVDNKMNDEDKTRELEKKMAEEDAKRQRNNLSKLDEISSENEENLDANIKGGILKDEVKKQLKERKNGQKVIKAIERMIAGKK